MTHLSVKKASKFIQMTFIGSMLVGVGPPPEGTTVDAKIGGGLDQFQTGSCGTTRYVHRTRHVSGEAGITRRFANGATVGVRGAGGGEEVLESSPLDPNEEFAADRSLKSETYGRYAATFRLGWHSKYFGGDVGISGGRFSRKFDGVNFAPSISLWGGKPEKIYGFISVLDRPLLLTSPTVTTIGFGSSLETIRWALGGKLVYEPGNADGRGGFFASAKAPIADALWLGGEISMSVAEGLPPFDASLLFSTTW